MQILMCLVMLQAMRGTGSWPLNRELTFCSWMLFFLKRMQDADFYVPRDAVLRGELDPGP